MVRTCLGCGRDTTACNGFCNRCWRRNSAEGRTPANEDDLPPVENRYDEESGPNDVAGGITDVWDRPNDKRKGKR